MVSSTASTRQPPAGGANATVDLGELLTRLARATARRSSATSRGFRAPVHQFAWVLLRDERAAVDATTEALVGGFRRATLDDAGDLEVLTYRQAFEACEKRSGDGRGRPGLGSAGRRAGGAATRGSSGAPAAEGRRRAGVARPSPARGAPAPRPRRAGQRPVGVVLGVDAAAAAARCCSRPGRSSARHCASAMATRRPRTVAPGRGGRRGGRRPRHERRERSRLSRHAEYCLPCRKVMREWTGTSAGLAVALARPPLPQALAAIPVFGDVTVEPAVAPAAPSRRWRPPRSRCARGRRPGWSRWPASRSPPASSCTASASSRWC